MSPFFNTCTNSLSVPIFVYLYMYMYMYNDNIWSVHLLYAGHCRYTIIQESLHNNHLEVYSGVHHHGMYPSLSSALFNSPFHLRNLWLVFRSSRLCERNFRFCCCSNSMCFCAFFSVWLSMSLRAILSVYTFSIFELTIKWLQRACLVVCLQITAFHFYRATAIGAAENDFRALIVM